MQFLWSNFHFKTFSCYSVDFYEKSVSKSIDENGGYDGVAEGGVESGDEGIYEGFEECIDVGINEGIDGGGDEGSNEGSDECGDQGSDDDWFYDVWGILVIDRHRKIN